MSSLFSRKMEEALALSTYLANFGLIALSALNLYAFVKTGKVAIEMEFVISYAGLALATTFMFFSEILLKLMKEKRKAA